VAAQTFAGENALEYLQLINQSEQGQLFIGKDGDLVFRDANAAAPSSVGLVTFADDGSGITYSNTTLDYGTELLYNRAVITSPAGTAIATDTLSQSFYGVIERQTETLLATQTELDELAAYITTRYSEPELRFASIRVDLDQVTPAQRATVIGLEIGDVVRVKFTPNQVGSQIDRYNQIIRIQHEIAPTQHIVTFGFDSLDVTPLVLDDTVFGTIDTTNVLGF